ncbi:MAG: ABC transporter transmembrane domain-containing protein, partial [Parvibaculaceae bacterium]
MLQVLSRSRPPGYGEKGQAETLREIMPWLWPPGRPDLRWRVAAAFAALLLSKVVTVATPFAFKYAIDGLNAAVTPEARPAVMLVAVPLAFILAYGFGRIMMVVLAQIRDALFAKVAQSAVRALSNRTFRHLHSLS